jgi:hypothetical protein
MRGGVEEPIPLNDLVRVVEVHQILEHLHYHSSDCLRGLLKVPPLWRGSGLHPCKHLQADAAVGMCTSRRKRLEGGGVVSAFKSGGSSAADVVIKVGCLSLYVHTIRTYLPCLSSI